MRRFSLRLLLDVLLWLGFSALASTGFLMAYRLPPRSGSRTVLGLTRHEWGEAHFYLALAFLGLLGFHLVLNGRWLSRALGTVLARGKPGGAGTAGWMAVGILAVLGGGMLAGPWMIPVEGADAVGPGRGGPPDITGSMTLEEAASAMGVEPLSLIEALGLPADTPRTARLGRLGQQYGFTMEKVRESVFRLKRGR